MHTVPAIQSTDPQQKRPQPTQLATVQTKRAGLFHAVKTTGDTVQKGDTLAYIYDSFEGDVLEEIKADVSGIIFFNYTKPLVYAKTIAYKILAE